jgi:Ca-activated chloride channel family protein
MTFLDSWRLVFLLVPILLAAAYVVRQRQRQKYAMRFSSVELLASVAPKRPGWQRHLPAAGLLAAVVLLVVGVARPAQATKVARERGTVIVALDTSESMGATDVSPNRLDAAKASAKRFVDSLPQGLQVGLLSFDQSTSMVVSPTSDRASVLAGIAQLQLGPGTATGPAISLALQAISALPPAADGTPAPAVIVLMSDGTPTVGTGDLSPEEALTQATTAAKAASVPVNTIAFGTPDGTVTVQGEQHAVPADPQAMAKIAQDTGGQTFDAETADQLAQTYSKIAGTIGYDTQTHEITVWFTAFGLIAAGLAAVAALVWSQRLT